MIKSTPASSKHVWMPLAGYRWIPLSLVCGLCFGAGARLAAHLHSIPVPVTAIAGPWFLLAFAAGAVTAHRVRGTVAGALALAGGLGGYYGYMRLAEHASLAYLLPELARWLPAGAVSGAIFGCAGAVWRTGSSTARAVAASFASGLLAGEAVAHLASSLGQGWQFGHSAAVLGIYYIELLAAIVLPSILVKEWAPRAACYTSALAIAGLALAAAPLLHRTWWIF